MANPFKKVNLECNSAKNIAHWYFRNFNAWSCTSRMVLLCALSGLSRRFQRWDLWLRPPSSSLSVVSCRDTRGRLRVRELIRWRDPGSWSLNQWGEGERKQRNGFSSNERTAIQNTATEMVSDLQSVSSISASASLSPWGSDSAHSSCAQGEHIKDSVATCPLQILQNKSNI